jgi:hypothetical protein
MAGHSVSANLLMLILLIGGFILSGKIKKEGIRKVKFKGDKRALDDLKILAEVNYGEDHMGKGIPLPKELSYLG